MFCSLRRYDSPCGYGLNSSRVFLWMFCLFLAVWKRVSLYDTTVPWKHLFHLQNVSSFNQDRRKETDLLLVVLYNWIFNVRLPLKLQLVRQPSPNIQTQERTELILEENSKVQQTLIFSFSHDVLRFSVEGRSICSSR